MGKLYDHESGYYYVSGRYYDPDAGVFIDAEDIEEVNAYGDLSRDAITSDNYLSVEANTFSIATMDKMTVDKTYDPDENRSWWEKNWLSLNIPFQWIVKKRIPEDVFSS